MFGNVHNCVFFFFLVRCKEQICTSRCQDQLSNLSSPLATSKHEQQNLKKVFPFSDLLPLCNFIYFFLFIFTSDRWHARSVIIKSLSLDSSLALCTVDVGRKKNTRSYLIWGKKKNCKSIQGNIDQHGIKTSLKKYTSGAKLILNLLYIFHDRGIKRMFFHRLQEAKLLSARCHKAL